MNVFVLGASSAIGSQLASAFSPGNNLMLVGRNLSRLKQAGQKCEKNGATSVTLLEMDLESGYSQVEDAAIQGNVELVINAASATSRLRDNELAADELATYVAVDLVAPVRLIQVLSKQRGSAPFGVIFVSSLLALVRSPNRVVYGGLKSAHELFLQKLMKSQVGRKLLIIRVGTPLPTDEVVDRTIQLANAARKAFDGDQKVLFYGLKGRILCWLYFTQPVVFRWVVEAQRKFKRSSSQ